MPKLWNETVEAHRREVRDAIMDAAAALAGEQGPLSLTMSEVAERTGIGRATLYKYYSGVEEILIAWHERRITGHLEHLAEIRDRAGEPAGRLERVLEAYGLISHELKVHHETDLGAFLHRDEQVARAEGQLQSMIRQLLTESLESGEVRDDVPTEELASYCIHALRGARSLASKAAVRRLVMVTLAGLQPPD